MKAKEKMIFEEVGFEHEARGSVCNMGAFRIRQEFGGGFRV